ncbi:NAD-dependent epimerase/dehydratase family protein [Streptomyces sp. bgisy022]|uniref:NAD-dependent epimerase/dehydratase family protein n=1 Tax=Streptomyces sp. bgisy022 TaxID=3413769 RepID=UPI003D71B10F
MTATVLLFGASGFLGTPVAERLGRDGRVGTLVRVSRRESPDGSGGPWLRHDLVADGTDALARLLHRVGPDAVVHCAGRLSGGPVALTETNILVTARLLEAMRVAAPSARLVVLGSAAEYGATTRGVPVREDAPTAPLSAYGVTRLASTRLVELTARDGALDAVVLRVFNPVGPGLPPENLLGRAAQALREAARTGADRITLGPLDAHRDFVDVRDVAAAVVRAALARHVPEPVLNVGSGQAVAAREAVALLARTAGFTGRVAETDPAPARSRAVPWIAADVERIRSALDWKPEHDLASSVRACWEG